MGLGGRLRALQERQRGDESERVETGSGFGLGGAMGGFGSAQVGFMVGLVGVFEVSAFFNDVLNHAAKKVGLESTEFVD